MCPVCWATLFATYTSILAVSAVTVAGTDRWTQGVAAAVAVLLGLHYLDLAWVPWWGFAAAGAALALRVAYLLVCRRSDLLVTRAWRTAMAVSKSRCPTRDGFPRSA